ncbi:hypothetical protein ACHAWF_001228 [Thalassiosira exigua]
MASNNEDWDDFASFPQRHPSDRLAALPGIVGTHRSSFSHSQSWTQHPINTTVRSTSGQLKGGKTEFSLTLRRPTGNAKTDLEGIASNPLQSVPAASNSSSMLSIEGDDSGLLNTLQPRVAKMRRSADSCPAKMISRTSPGTKRSAVHPRSPCPSQSCVESYGLFRQCNSGSKDLSAVSCGAAVASYMKCALDHC